MEQGLGGVKSQTLLRGRNTKREKFIGCKIRKPIDLHTSGDDCLRFERLHDRKSALLIHSIYQSHALPSMFKEPEQIPTMLDKIRADFFMLHISSIT